MDEQLPKVDQWTLAGPLPDQMALVARSTLDPFERRFLQALTNNERLIASEAAHCYARESGLFFLAHQEFPHQQLRQFMISRCGAVSSASSRYVTFTKNSPDEVDLDALGDRFSSEIDKLSAELAAHDQGAEVGIWIGQDAKAIMIHVVRMRRSVTLNPIPLRPSGPLVIEGKLLDRDAQRVQGSFTEGEHEARDCVTDTRIQLPHFRLACQVRLIDAQTTLRISTSRSNNIFATSLTRLVLWPGQQPPKTWRSSPVRQVLVNAPEMTGSAEELLLARINLVRQSVGLNTHSLASEQSNTARAIAPRWLKAALDEDDSTTNKLLLGLLAGWQVRADIVDADFVSTFTGHPDQTALLTELLDDPSGRQVLLAREPAQIAFGILEQEDQIGVLALSYTLLVDEDHARRAGMFTAAINAARKANNLASMVRDNNLNAAAEKIAAEVNRRELSLEDAAKKFGAEGAREWGSRVNDYTLDASRLRRFKPGPNLLSDDLSRVAVMITTYKPVDYPWTVYGIVLVLPER